MNILSKQIFNILLTYTYTKLVVYYGDNGTMIE